MNTNIKLIGGTIVALFMIVGGAYAETNPGPLKFITSIPNSNLSDPVPSQPPLISDVAIPQPDLNDYVANDAALLQLGKALFWDMQAGSDGVQACASCHFHAGADNRSKNQINPNTTAATMPTTFQVGFGANYQLTKKDYPFHKLSKPNCRTDDKTTPLCLIEPLSKEISNTDSVTGSQGVFKTQLVATLAGKAADKVTSEEDKLFNVGGVNTRQVQGRNTPSVINAVYYQLQFWDGRAKDIFNGANIKGTAGESTAHLFKANTPNDTLVEITIALPDSSLASQTTGPLTSSTEMSASGRMLQHIGFKFLAKNKKLHTLRPLGQQLVHPDDGVLGKLSRSPQKGLNISYDDLIRKAFKPEWWKSNQIIQDNGNDIITIDMPKLEVGQNLPANQYQLMEWDFSLFAALAIQRYESTLVSDQTPFDKFQAGDTNALSPSQTAGLAIFVNKDIVNGGGNCNTCHGIPEFTRASVRHTGGSSDLTKENGFFTDYGVTPAAEDLGAGTKGNVLTTSATTNKTTTADGTKSIFKAAGLRNIGLTAPYMHNGGFGSLKEVVQFYTRGKDGPTPVAPATISRLNLSEEAQANLVEFLKLGLTDRRVALHIAPFDHPQLFIPNGHQGHDFSVTAVEDSNWPIATDQLKEIPAVGKYGLSKASSNFLESKNQEKDTNKSGD